jgi:hypothetical protein
MSQAKKKGIFTFKKCAQISVTDLDSDQDGSGSFLVRSGSLKEL